MYVDSLQHCHFTQTAIQTCIGKTWGQTHPHASARQEHSTGLASLQHLHALQPTFKKSLYKKQTCTRIYHHNIFPGKSCGSLTATWTCCFHRFTDKPNHVRVSGLALGKRNFFLNSHGSLRALECKMPRTGKSKCGTSKGQA